MQFTTSDGLTLDVNTYGPEDAPLTVALIHCWVVSQEEWGYQVRDLLREFGHRIRILTWDHRGHGKSDDVCSDALGIHLLAQDAGEVLDRFAPRGDLVLAGHSIGGMTMMELAEQRPDILARVRGAVFVATSAGHLDTDTLLHPRFGKVIKPTLPRLFALRSKLLTKRARRRAPAIERVFVRHFLFGRPPLRLADVATTVDGLLACSAASLMGHYKDLMEHDRAALLKHYDGIPTDVLAGALDLLTPRRHAEQIAEAIEGSRLQVLPGAGHMLPFERDAEVTEAIAGHVRRLLDA